MQLLGQSEVCAFDPPYLLSEKKTPRVTESCVTSRSVDLFDVAFTQNDMRRDPNTTKFKSARSVEFTRSESGRVHELSYRWRAKRASTYLPEYPFMERVILMRG